MCPPGGLPPPPGPLPHKRAFGPSKKTKLSHSFDLEESDEVSKVNPDAKNETIKSEPKYFDPEYHADKNIENVEVDIVATDFDTEGDMINDDTIGDEEFEDYEANEG